MENITNEQRALLERLRDVAPSVEVSWDEARGVASSIRGRLGFADVADPAARASAFLNAYGPLIGPTDVPQSQFLLRSEQDDIQWNHLFYAYMIAGEIELYGARLAFHLAPSGNLIDVESSLVCGNPPQLDRRIPLDLRLEAHLPESWQVALHGIRQGELLNPGEERQFEVVIDMPLGADEVLELPLDGDLRGTLSGDLAGRFTGSLSDASLVGRNRLIGQFSALVDGVGSACGSFEGRINLRTGWLTGTVNGPHPDKVGVNAHLEIKARLRPWRRVEISQWAGDQILGGVTVQVQVPGRRVRFGYRLPITNTQVVAEN